MALKMSSILNIYCNHPTNSHLPESATTPLPSEKKKQHLKIPRNFPLFTSTPHGSSICGIPSVATLSLQLLGLLCFCLSGGFSFRILLGLAWDLLLWICFFRMFRKETKGPKKNLDLESFKKQAQPGGSSISNDPCCFLSKISQLTKNEKNSFPKQAGSLSRFLSIMSVLKRRFSRLCVLPTWRKNSKALLLRCQECIFYIEKKDTYTWFEIIIV